MSSSNPEINKKLIQEVQKYIEVRKAHGKSWMREVDKVIILLK
jgi:hypothetical protein